MLSNLLAETFADFSDIDWVKVAKRQEFVGHTEYSLKNIFKQTLKNTKLKFGMDNSTVSLKHLVEYCEQVYEEGGGRMEANLKKVDRQKEVIAFFERKVAGLGIKDFVNWRGRLLIVFKDIWWLKFLTNFAPVFQKEKFQYK